MSCDMNPEVLRGRCGRCCSKEGAKNKKGKEEEDKEKGKRHGQTKNAIRRRYPIRRTLEFAEKRNAMPRFFLSLSR